MISNRSMSESFIFALSSTFFVAGIGPVSMIVGSTPTCACATKRARGRRPSCFAFSLEPIRTAAAPSVICEEAPAEITPSGLKTGLSVFILSRFASARGPSSVSIVFTSLPVLSYTGTGTISFLKRPSFMAWTAFLCDSNENWSISSRVTL